MKMHRTIIWLLLFSLTSCDGLKDFVPKSTFDSSFPKRNRDLTHILGDHLTLKHGTDTLELSISAFKNYNLIVNSKTGDTIFKGIVNKFRGLYYFNEQLDDTSYCIYAVKVTDNVIYGINSSLAQTVLIDRVIKNGEYQKLVKYITPDEIRLHPDKKELRELFSAIITNIQPDTIIHSKKISSISQDTTKTITQIDPEDFELLSKVYPNPATDFVTIELQQKNKVTYQLVDLNGKMILQGEFLGTIHKIDLSKQSNGFFALTLIDSIGNQKESIKIIKSK